MVSTVLRSPYRHLDLELQREVREGSLDPLKAVSIQIKKSKKTGRRVHPALHYARKAKEHRIRSELIDSGEIPSLKREVPKDHSLRIFESRFDTANSRLYGQHSRNFVDHLASNVDPDAEFLITRKHKNKKQEKQSYLAQILRKTPLLNSTFARTEDDQFYEETISAKDFFTWLVKNDVLSKSVLNKLVELNKGRGNQGPGLGPMNERRAGLALAILKDAGLVDDFEVCGEAGKPLSVGKVKANSIDYSKHEEAMAIDILVKLKSMGLFEYLPVQIKSSGSSDYDEEERYLTFNAREKYILEKALPQTIGLFVEDKFKPHSYRLKLKRKVLKMSLNERKLIKKHTRDYEPDIVNKMMAAIEFSQAEGKTLRLEKPYTSLPYAQKVIALIKQGFLTPVKSKEKDFAKTYKPVPETRLSFMQKMLKLFIHESNR